MKDGCYFQRGTPPYGETKKNKDREHALTKLSDILELDYDTVNSWPQDVLEEFVNQWTRMRFIESIR